MEANSTGSPSGVDQSEGLVKQRKRDGSSSSTRQSRPRQSSTGEENKVNGTNDGSGRPASTKTIAIITDGSHSVKTIIGPPSKPYSDSELSSSWSTSLHDPSSLPNSPASSKTTKSADSTVDVTTSSSSDIGGKGTVSLKISAKESPDSLSPDAGVLIERKDGNSRIEKKSTKVLKGEARTSVSKKPPSPSATAVDLTNLKMAPKSLQTNYPTNLEGKPPAETRTAPAVAKKLKPPPPSSPDPKVVAQTAKSTSNLKAPPPVSSVTKAKPSAILNDPSPSQQAVPTASSASAARLPPSSESRKSSRSVQAPLPPTKSSENQPGTRTPDTTKSCSSSVASSLSDASRQESASQRRSTTNNKLAAMEAAVQETVVGRASSKSLPGAYLVQGSNMELARAGVLTSPRNETLSTVNGVNTTSTPFVATGNEIHATLVVENEDVESGDSNGNRKPTTKKKKSRKASKSDTNNSVVVASELTDDIEATIEREVQRRLLEQTTKAHLVSIDHGNHRILPPAEEEKRIAELKDVYRPKGVREKLFGDVRQSVDIAASPECIRKREYLQWSVKRNPTTAQWVASVMTNQRAMQEGDTIEMELSKVSYSAATQQEAYETGLANATPMMHSLGENPICFICKAKFAVFRRGCNCRNCGVCVCSACTTSWPAKMLPDTYLTKKDKAVVPACIACDWLVNSFREALLDGNYQAAVNLYETGNINLRSPFCLDKRGEDLYPIHLAILGGNLHLVRWLASGRFCPLRAQKKKGKKLYDDPLQSSKGTSPLEIALFNQRLDIVHYLVVEMNQPMFEENILVNSNMALANFTSLLNMLPRGFFEGRQPTTTSLPVSGPGSLAPTISRSENISQRRPSL